MSVTWVQERAAGAVRGYRVTFNETENRFAVLAESLPQLVWSARADGTIDYLNRRWQEFTGLTTEFSLGAGWQAAIHPCDLPRVLDRWQKAVASGAPYEDEYRVRSATGHYEWVLSRAMPSQDPSGAIARWFGTSTNINAQKQAEEAVRSLESQYRLALEAADLGTWQIDLETKLVTWDEGCCALHHIPQGGLFSTSLDEAYAAIHQDDRERVQRCIEHACKPGGSGHYECEYRVHLVDGQVRWFRSVGQTIFTQDGPERRPVRLSGVLSDITDRKASEEAQQLLTRELNHRVKNLFAIANGMVSMTARTAKDPKEMASALRGRLGALSRAHELVQPAAASPQSIGSEVELGRLCEAVIEPYRQGGPSRIAIEGPSVHIGSNATTSLALVLHELATNAGKYGSLSQSEGHLSLHWTVHDDMVDFQWIETGGPAIEAAPEFEGFGTQLSQRSIAGQLGGTLDREWLMEGLRVHMTLPLNRLTG
jgi:PAS domain S-box-containing protein